MCACAIILCSLGDQGHTLHSKMSGIWSAELSSRLPGTPVREGDTQHVINAQPQPTSANRESTVSPLWKEMSHHFTELDLLMEL